MHDLTQPRFETLKGVRCWQSTSTSSSQQLSCATGCKPAAAPAAGVPLSMLVAQLMYDVCKKTTDLLRADIRACSTQQQSTATATPVPCHAACPEPLCRAVLCHAMLCCRYVLSARTQDVIEEASGPSVKLQIGSGQGQLPDGRRYVESRTSLKFRTRSKQSCVCCALACSPSGKGSHKCVSWQAAKAWVLAHVMQQRCGCLYCDVRACQPRKVIDGITTQPQMDNANVPQWLILQTRLILDHKAVSVRSLMPLLLSLLLL